jgi:hypothetical protein
MENLSGVVGHLKKELQKAQQEAQRYTAALAALGSAGFNGQRTLSASARRRISLAQKKRWAQARNGIAHGSGRAENNGLGSYQTHHLGIRPQQDRGGTAGTVGEDTGGKKKAA